RGSRAERAKNVLFRPPGEDVGQCPLFPHAQPMSAFGGKAAMVRPCGGHKPSRVSLPWRRTFGAGEAANVEPSVNRKRKPNDRNQRRDDRNDKECDSIEE